ncbi:zinc finger protein 653 [Halichoeres trimaculatus]|uniref:zinc finger protein 653 n=1 Tax=Halichoeres trimaculatus TaxID=147232 RepID=UPI003D9F3FB4
MAHSLAELDVSLDPDQARDHEKSVLRRCRGRPRLTDSDRAKRRLESRKKYDVRRVYLGESHKLWSELRRRTSLSDAGLAEYLILLNSTYGDKLQEHNFGKKLDTGDSLKQRKGRKEHVSSLQSLVRWYQEHSCSCPHEPQLRAVEHQHNSSTAAIWQCDANHSFVQYLFSPLREASDSEHEEEVNGECDGEETAKADMPMVTRFISGRRKRAAHNQSKDLEKNMDDTELQLVTMSPIEKAATLNHPSAAEAPSKDVPHTGQPVWEVGMVMEPEQGSPAAEFHPIPSEGEEAEEAQDLRQSRDEGEEQDEELRTIPHSYECIAVTASLTEKPEKTYENSSGTVRLSAQPGLSLPPSAPVQEQSELFDPPTLQTVVSSCEIPDQRPALEGSQLIIITGPSYEALTSEGIQLNMGGGNVEEVTCTVIGGVTYNQVCGSDSKLQSAEDEDFITGLSDKQLLQPAVDVLELGNNRELQRSLNRSKRHRRGPVIEADGMLKMFHCPYEGCSQVYVAISSFQNHVNLVHRKGRTKVCSHPGCGKKFYLSNHLQRHMIIHSGVRDFICETCGKSFKRKNHLEVHRRTHTGETPLQCEICGYQCRQRASLNWHMKKHTPEAHYNFTCEFCEKRFEKLDSVKFHKLKSHPDKQAT